MTEQDSRRGYLESILAQVPGFKGYMARENRRDSDKACRDHLAGRLEKSKRAVGDAKRRLLASGQFMGIERLDRVSDRLEKVASKVRYAERGFSGFFDSQQVGATELERLHEADLALTEFAVRIEEKLDGLGSASAGESMDSAVEAVLDAIESFERKFDERRSVMTEVD